jgi:threonine/homoserine/homoserine lactone efflux protein
VPARSNRRLWVDGYVVGVANPKVIVFFAAILTQFVDPDGAPVPLQMAVLGLVFVLIALVSDGAWGLMAGTARGWLARSPRRLSVIGGTGGLVTVGLGVRLAVSGRAE